MRLVTLEPFAFCEQDKWDYDFGSLEVIFQEDGGSFMSEYIMRNSVKNDFNNLEVEWI